MENLTDYYEIVFLFNENNNPYSDSYVDLYDDIKDIVNIQCYYHDQIMELIKRNNIRQ